MKLNNYRDMANFALIVIALNISHFFEWYFYFTVAFRRLTCLSKRG